MYTPTYLPSIRPKICFVPTCSNNNVKNPDLKFFCIRKELKDKWCQSVGRTCPLSILYTCEHHIDLKEDIENYEKWLTLGSLPKLKLSATVKNIPSPPAPRFNIASPTSKKIMKQKVAQYRQYHDKNTKRRERPTVWIESFKVNSVPYFYILNEKPPWKEAPTCSMLNQKKYFPNMAAVRGNDPLRIETISTSSVAANTAEDESTRKKPLEAAKATATVTYTRKKKLSRKSTVSNKDRLWRETVATCSMVVNPRGQGRGEEREGVDEEEDCSNDVVRSIEEPLLKETVSNCYVAAQTREEEEWSREEVIHVKDEPLWKETEAISSMVRHTQAEECSREVTVCEKDHLWTSEVTQEKECPSEDVVCVKDEPLWDEKMSTYSNASHIQTENCLQEESMLEESVATSSMEACPLNEDTPCSIVAFTHLKVEEEGPRDDDVRVKIEPLLEEAASTCSSATHTQETVSTCSPRQTQRKNRSKPGVGVKEEPLWKNCSMTATAHIQEGSESMQEELATCSMTGTQEEERSKREAVHVKFQPVLAQSVSTTQCPREEGLLKTLLMQASPPCHDRGQTWGVSAAAARAGLYAGHAVKDELVVGPECLHKPMAIFTRDALMRRVRSAQHDHAYAAPERPPATEKLKLLASGMKDCCVRLERCDGRTRLTLTTEPPPQEKHIYECDSCGNTYKHKRNLVDHMRKTHLKSYVPKSKREQRHIRREKHIYECDSCGNIYKHKRNLVDHMRKTHLKSYVPKSKREQRHIRREKHIYECDSCGNTYKHKRNLVDHMRKTHLKSYIPKSKREQRHIRREKHIYECDSCGNTYKLKRNLVRHMSKTHLKSYVPKSKREQCHKKENSFSCQTCRKTFTRKSYLRRHTLIHAGVRSHICQICNKGFEVFRDLKNHERAHSIEREKSFPCNVCHAKFSQRCNLKAHKRIHMNLKPFTCEVCNNRFTELSTLNRHRRTHTREKPYRCTICQKRFTYAYTLQVHQRIHSGETPYSCDMCTKRFSRRDTLLRHHVRHHTVKRPVTGTRGVKRSKKEAKVQPTPTVEDEGSREVVVRVKIEPLLEEAASTCSSATHTHTEECSNTLLMETVSACSPVQTHRGKSSMQDVGVKEEPLWNNCSMTATAHIQEGSESMQEELATSFMTGNQEEERSKREAVHVKFQPVLAKSVSTDKTTQYPREEGLLKTLLMQASPLYAGHAVKDELVVGPECLHKPEAMFTREKLTVSASRMKDAPLERRDGRKHQTLDTEPPRQKDNIYECDSCGNTYQHKRNLVCHIQTHLKSKVPKSKRKRRLKDTDTTSIQHRKSREVVRHKKKKTFSCDTCSKKFTRKDHLQKHTLIHEGVKPYICQTCNKGFRTTSGLQVHIRTHTGEKPYSCNVCNKEFSHSCNLKEHKLIHTNLKPYVCEICNNRFKQSSTLRKHKNTHFPSEKGKGSRKRKRSEVCCTICRKRFTTLYSLKIHQRIHSGEKPYSCDICMEQFSRKDTLLYHVLYHAGKGPLAKAKKRSRQSFS